MHWLIHFVSTVSVGLCILCICNNTLIQISQGGSYSVAKLQQRCSLNQREQLLFYDFCKFDQTIFRFVRKYFWNFWNFSNKPKQFLVEFPKDVKQKLVAVVQGTPVAAWPLNINHAVFIYMYVYVFIYIIIMTHVRKENVGLT